MVRAGTRVVKHCTCKVVRDFNVWTDQVIEAGCLYHIKINKKPSAEIEIWLSNTIAESSWTTVRVALTSVGTLGALPKLLVKLP